MLYIASFCHLKFQKPTTTTGVLKLPKANCRESEESLILKVAIVIDR